MNILFSILAFCVLLLIKSGLRNAMRFIYRKLFNSNPKREIQEGAAEFVEALEKLNYFCYTDVETMDTVKNEIMYHYDPEMEFFTYSEDSNELSADYRVLIINWDTLNSDDSIPKIISNLEPAFQKIGVRFQVSDHYARYDKNNGIINEWLVVNGKKHIIFDNQKGGNPAVISIQKVAEMINYELDLQQKEERIYLGGIYVYTFLMLLTSAQFQFIEKVYTDPEEKPLTPGDWAEMCYQNS